MRATLQGYVAVIAVVFQVGAYVGQGMEIVRDPLYLLLSAFGAAALGSWYAAASWFEWRKVESPIENENQHAASVRWEYSRSIWVRLFSLVLVLVLWGIFAAMIWSQGGGALDLAETGPVRYASLSTMIVRKPSADLTTYEEDMPYARTYKPETLSFFYDRVNFSILKRPRIPWIEVEKVRVVVDDYNETIPEGTKRTLVFKGDIRAFIVVLDNQVSQSFEARPLPTVAVSVEGQAIELENHNIRLIESSTPTYFDLLVTAKTPGVYTYHIELDLRHRWPSDPIELLPRRTIVFLDEPPESAMGTPTLYEPPTTPRGPSPIPPVAGH